MSVYDVMENNFNELLGAAEQVVDSADDTGCSSDLIVIDREAYNHIANVVSRIRVEIAKFD